ncbi:hypothetical protein JFL47_12005 [Haemophilus haemoglobinophilus]|nr:hypothetical protein [Canicola haemoglobinophilus]MBN6711930.1 hypothetical protein [Canicola haemoglobinophilus]
MQLQNIKWVIAGLALVSLPININAEPNKTYPDKNVSNVQPKNSTNNKGFQFSKFDESAENEKVSYLSYKNTSFNPQNSNNDAKALANSIEFEVYQISENKFSHTVFESGAGVCSGFSSNYGVEITDSRTYYINKPKNEYYASITGATAYSKMDINNMQYAPIFNIQDQELAKNIQAQEKEKGKELAEKNIKKSIKMLETVICK